MISDYGKLLGFVATLGLLTALAGAARGAELAAGDVAVIAYNADAPDAFAWLALAPVPAGTAIHFTDSSVSNAMFYWTEHLDSGSQSLGKGGPLVWRHNRALAAGTVVTFNSASGAWSVGTASNNYPHLSTSGDQLFAYTGTITHNEFLFGDYQGDPAAATMLYGVNFGNAGWADAPGSSYSGIPSGLSTGAFTAVHVGARDNGYYSGMLTGTVSELRQAIATPGNWVTSDSPFDLSLWPRRFEVLQDTLLFEFSQVRRATASRHRFVAVPERAHD